MVTPGSIVDWVTGAGILGALAMFVAIGYRWMPGDAELAEARVASQEFRDFPFSAMSDRDRASSSNAHAA